MDSNDEKEKERLKKYAAFLEPWSDIYGFKYSDIPYDIDGKIKNTFKKGEINYDEDIGNINDGKDYDKSEKNIYDLYIPYSSFIKKKSKGIFLFFHGLGDTKNTIEGLCARYTKNGYITATIETTSLGGSKETSIFKSLDETTYCIISIKNKLSKMNFNPETLEIALGGHSAGAYNALLYSYFMRKNCPIPIKFVINLCAQATMDPNYWFKFKNPEESLENLNEETIENAKKEGKLIPMNENESLNLIYMNLFIGVLFKEKELKIMVKKDGKILRDNSNFIKLLKIYEKASPLFYANKECIPTLNVYAGRDEGVSVCQIMILKKKLDENNVPNDLVYMRYAGHMLNDFESENGIDALRSIHYYIMLYAEKYFKKN